MSIDVKIVKSSHLRYGNPHSVRSAQVRVLKPLDDRTTESSKLLAIDCKQSTQLDCQNIYLISRLEGFTLSNQLKISAPSFLIIFDLDYTFKYFIVLFTLLK